MRRFEWLTFVLVAALVACGGGAEEATTETEPAPATEEMAAPAALTVPAWMSVDEAAATVTLGINSGESEANNRWNFNGMFAGSGSITVPEGYTVTINFVNSDPTQPHSIGIGEKMDTYPAVFEDPQAVFEGAMSADANTTGTAPNGSAQLTFTASAAGEYAMICYIAGHAVAGMVVDFNVSADGSYGATQ